MGLALRVSWSGRANRLDRPSFVINRVIGLHEPDSHPSERRWKDVLHLAYSLGEDCAKQLILDFDVNVDRPTTPEAAKAWLHRDLTGTLRRKACFAMRNLSLDDPKVAARVVQLYLQTYRDAQKADVEREHAERAVQEGADQFREFIRKSFDAESRLREWAPQFDFNACSQARLEKDRESNSVGEDRSGSASAASGDS